MSETRSRGRAELLIVRGLGRAPALDRPTRRIARASTNHRRIKALAWLLAAVAVGMPGWIVVLGVSPPSSTSPREWRLVWIGFDAGELGAVLVTLWAVYRSGRSPYQRR